MSSILITGASTGIGRASAAELARRGHQVVAPPGIRAPWTGLHVDQRLRLDVTDQASVGAAVEQAGEIDVLISSAGVIFRAAVEASPAAEIERLYAQNTAGAIRVTQAVLPQMRQQKGRVLFVSNVCGRAVVPGQAAYSATKAAREAFAETLAIEVAGFSIDVTRPAGPGQLRCPGRRAHLPPARRPAPGPGRTRRPPRARMISPEQIAQTLADLAERPAVRLRVPVGDLAEHVIAARNAAPYHQPFVRAESRSPAALPRAALGLDSHGQQRYGGIGRVTLMSHRAAPANCRLGWIVVLLVVLIVAGPAACATTARPSTAGRLSQASVSFHTLPPGAKLPSGAQCATLVNSSPQPEDKPANKPYNSRKGRHVSAEFLAADGPRAQKLARRINGDFTGTTIDILRWAACKWGISQDIVFAQAAVESWWQQDTLGGWTADSAHCPPRYKRGQDGKRGECPQTYGILQNTYQPGGWPAIARSTAMNADAAYAIWRSCYDGYETWLNSMPRGRQYHKGDVWGCVGRWFSGQWRNPPALGYIAQVKQYLREKIWLKPNFLW